MRNFSFIILYLVIVSIPLFAQLPDTLWTRTFGGDSTDVGKYVQQTVDGGFIILCNTNSFSAGDMDVWLIKTDSAGDEEWSETYGGDWDDVGYGVQQTNDGGFIFVGGTASFDNNSRQVWVVKTGSDGVTEWTQTFGGDYWDEGYSVQQTNDGGYVIVGSTSSFGAGSEDAWLIKTDASGVIIWDHTFGGLDQEQFQSVRETADGGYVIAGETVSFSAGLGDVWLIKVNSEGTELWNQTFGGIEDDEAYCVELLQDGGFIVSGTTRSIGAGELDAWLIRTDNMGTEVWNQTYGGSENDYGYSVIQTLDEGFALTGATHSYGSGLGDAWLIKTDSAGYELWSQTYGSTSDDSAQDIQEVFDGGFVLTGYNDFLGGGQYDLWLIRVDGDLMRIISPNGGEEWRLGTEHDIRWQSTSVEDVIIELMDGDVVGRILTEGTPNDGIFEWAIPTDVVPNDNYYIRLNRPLYSGDL